MCIVMCIIMCIRYTNKTSNRIINLVISFVVARRYRSLVWVIDGTWCDSKDCLITPIDTQVENAGSYRRDLLHCATAVSLC